MPYRKGYIYNLYADYKGKEYRLSKGFYRSDVRLLGKKQCQEILLDELLVYLTKEGI